MIPSLYKPFKKWADTGSIYILSDLHFDDADCRLMDRNWISSHMQIEKYAENCKHINLAANVCDYMPVSLGKLIKEGILTDIVDLHRMTINKAVEKKVKELDRNPIAQTLSELEKEAYYEYLGPVERLCDNLDSTENDVGLMLDYLLSFCGNSKVLGLYKKVCRTFYEIYPACISEYIKYYLEEYKPELFKEDCEDYLDLSVVEKDNSK